jgi:hypothetical protein
MSKLFGVTTTKSLNEIKQYIKQVRTAQDALAHVVDRSLTIINKTATHVRRNEQALNRLSQSSILLKRQVANLTSQMRSLKPQVLKNTLTNFIQDIMRTVNRSLREIYFDISILNSLTIQLMSGQFPVMLIPPNEFENDLRTIRNQLPTNLLLPFQPEEVRMYYKSLHTTLVPDKDSTFHIITAIPLVHQGALYDLFKIVHVPIPLPDSEHSFTFNLEAEYIAVSVDRQSYLIPDTTSAALCVSTHLTFCDLKSPILKSSNCASCVMSLFLKNVNRIKKTCEHVISRSSPYPESQYLIEGQWLISSSKRVMTDILCVSENGDGFVGTKQYVIKKGVSVLKMNRGCALKSKYIYLPPYFRKENLRSLVLFDGELNEHLEFPDDDIVPEQSFQNTEDSEESQVSVLGQIDNQISEEIFNLKRQLNTTVLFHDNLGSDRSMTKRLHSFVIVALLVNVIGLLGYSLWRCRLTRKNNRHIEAPDYMEPLDTSTETSAPPPPPRHGLVFIRNNEA